MLNIFFILDLELWSVLRGNRKSRLGIPKLPINLPTLHSVSSKILPKILQNLTELFLRPIRPSDMAF